MYMQLWTLGRATRPECLIAEDPDLDVVGPSDVPIKGTNSFPRALTIAEIKEIVETYRIAAINAVHKAGCDGIELHMANGYLIDQFIQDVSNFRTDQYGGSIENRCRFPLEILEAVVQAVGQEKVAMRISPWSTFQGNDCSAVVPNLCCVDLVSRYAYGGSNSDFYLPHFPCSRYVPSPFLPPRNRVRYVWGCSYPHRH
jgi:NADPH2 dehydrogenase